MQGKIGDLPARRIGSARERQARVQGYKGRLGRRLGPGVLLMSAHQCIIADLQYHSRNCIAFTAPLPPGKLKEGFRHDMYSTVAARRYVTGVTSLVPLSWAPALLTATTRYVRASNDVVSASLWGVERDKAAKLR